MAWVWLLLCCQLVWLPAGQGGYHRHSATKITQHMPLINSYFGYSITYEPVSKRLIVSAPQGDNIGEIFSCDIKLRSCEKMPRSIERTDNYTQSYWLGAVVKAAPSYFLTCAPLTVKQSTYKTHKLYFGTHSRCYKYDTNTTSISPNPLKNIESVDRLAGTVQYEESMETFGWSIDIAEGNFIIGGPAMFNGRALKYYDVEKTPIAVNGLGGRADFNFGYSVAAGYFYVLSNRTLSYAIGSPYGISGYGKVSLYSSKYKDMVHQGDLECPDVDHAVGAMFGAVLCAARFTHDEANALIVGAPTYATTNQHSVGAVYIYDASTQLQELPALRTKIVGYYEGSYFGSAVISIGDLDDDGKDEIAIAAPYENSGTGAVYLYSGAAIVQKQHESFMQKIVPEPADSMMAFGLSLAAVEDFDENGCNELAIGAPESDKVMVLQCIASVKVELFEEIEVRKLVNGTANPLRKETRFEFNSCLRAYFPEKPHVVTADIRVQVQILDHPNVTLTYPEDKWYDIHLDRSKTIYCKPISINTPKGANYEIPIWYKITATQQHPPTEKEEFDATHLLLSDRSRLESYDFISLADCNNTNNCMPHLDYLDIGLSIMEPYVIGSTENIDVSIKVVNKGEPAYDACLRMSAMAGSDGLIAPEVPAGCARDHGTAALVCTPGTNLHHNDKWNISAISFKVDDLTNEYKYITFSIQLYNHCSKNDFKPHIKKLLLNSNSSGIVIMGITDSGSSNDVTLSEDDNDLGRAFQQSYMISNSGPTNWAGLTATLTMQKRSFITHSTINRINDATTPKVQTCYLIRETKQQKIFRCNIGKLFKKNVAKITVPFFMEPNTIESAISYRINTVYTYLTIDIDINEDKEFIVQSTLIMGSAPVSLWMIIASSVLALVVLLIIFFILKQCGFFERKTKGELQEVQKSVKRQTIMRRSMADGARIQAEPDREALLELAKAAAEHVSGTDNRLRIDPETY